MKTIKLSPQKENNTIYLNEVIDLDDSKFYLVCIYSPNNTGFFYLHRNFNCLIRTADLLNPNNTYTFTREHTNIKSAIDYMFTNNTESKMDVYMFDYAQQMYKWVLFNRKS